MTTTPIIPEDIFNFNACGDEGNTDASVAVGTPPVPTVLVINGPADVVVGTPVVQDDVCLTNGDIFNPYAGTTQVHFLPCVTNDEFISPLTTPTMSPGWVAYSCGANGTSLCTDTFVATTTVGVAPHASTLPATGGSTIIGLTGVVCVAVGMFFRHVSRRA